MPLQKRQVFLFVEKFGSDDVRPDLIKLRSVQSSRWDGAIFLMIPGTSCQATMVLSLRDKSHSPIEVPHNYLSAYGVKPCAEWREDSAIQPLALYTIRRNGGYLKSIARWREQITGWKPMLLYAVASPRWVRGDGFTLDRANARRSEEQCC